MNIGKTHFPHPHFLFTPANRGKGCPAHWTKVWIWKKSMEIGEWGPGTNEKDKSNHLIHFWTENHRMCEKWLKNICTWFPQVVWSRLGFGCYFILLSIISCYAPFFLLIWHPGTHTILYFSPYTCDLSFMLSLLPLNFESCNTTTPHAHPLIIWTKLPSFLY